MTLPIEAEELLDDLRRRKLDESLNEIAKLIEWEGISETELEFMQVLERWILKVYRMEGEEGYRQRQAMCEEMAKVKYGDTQRKAS